MLEDNSVLSVWTLALIAIITVLRYHVFIIRFIFKLFMPRKAYPRDKQITWVDGELDEKTCLSQGYQYILFYFSGPNWCGYCIELDKAVFSKKAELEKKYPNVLFHRLDFPKPDKQNKDIISYNKKQASRFKTKGYPSLYLIKTSTYSKRYWFLKEARSLHGVVYTDKLNGFMKKLDYNISMFESPIQWESGQLPNETLAKYEHILLFFSIGHLNVNFKLPQQKELAKQFPKLLFHNLEYHRITADKNIGKYNETMRKAFLGKDTTESIFVMSIYDFQNIVKSIKTDKSEDELTKFLLSKSLDNKKIKSTKNIVKTITEMIS